MLHEEASEKGNLKGDYISGGHSIEYQFSIILVCLRIDDFFLKI